MKCKTCGHEMNPIHEMLSHCENCGTLWTWLPEGEGVFEVPAIIPLVKKLKVLADSLVENAIDDYWSETNHPIIDEYHKVSDAIKSLLEGKHDKD